MSLTEADWLRIFVGAGVRAVTAADWAPAAASEWQPSAFSKGMDDIRAMLPQVLHECRLFEQLEEGLTYTTPERIRAVWPSRFPNTAAALPYVCAPKKLANFVYANRMGNGNEASGDGWNFRGRSPIMLTGLDAYLRMGKVMGQDLDVNPTLIMGPFYGCELVRRWWEGEIPDSMLSDTVKLRRRVNGGTVGLEHVQQLAARVDAVLA